MINDTNELQIQNFLADLIKIQSKTGPTYIHCNRKKNILLNRQNVRKLKYQLINDTNELQFQNSLADLIKIQSITGLNYSPQQYRKKNSLLDRQNVRKLQYQSINETNELQIKNSLAELTKNQSETGLNYSLQQK